MASSQLCSYEHVPGTGIWMSSTSSYPYVGLSVQRILPLCGFHNKSGLFSPMCSLDVDSGIKMSLIVQSISTKMVSVVSIAIKGGVTGKVNGPSFELSKGHEITPPPSAPNINCVAVWISPPAHYTKVKLCGHATLAYAYTLFTNELVNSDIIEFETLSVILTAKKGVDFKSPIDVSSSIHNVEAPRNFLSVELDFPIVCCTEFDSDEISAVSRAFNGADIIDIKTTTLDGNALVVLPSSKSFVELKPKIDDIRKCAAAGMIVTGAAPMESGFDFVSRCFFPKGGINEVIYSPTKVLMELEQDTSISKEWIKHGDFFPRIEGEDEEKVA